MLPSRLAETLLTLVTLSVQILIADRFFSDWRKRLSPAAARISTVLLAILWAAFLFATPFRFQSLAMRLRDISLPMRTTLIAIGNLWGMTAVPSFAIFLIWQFFARGKTFAHSPQRRRLLHAAGTIAVAAPFAAVAFGVVERTAFHIKEVELPVPNLHPDLVGLRIGQLSDLHVSPWLSVRDAGRAVDMLNELKPHLTVVTGDVITQPGDPLDDAMRELGRLRADLGVLGCLGNHERYVQCEDYETAVAAKYGIGILRDEARRIRWGSGVLNVAGIDYQARRDGPYLKGAEGLVVPGMANLLLSHNPDTFPDAVRKGYDAVLSGHTHGGQVTIEVLNQTLNFARFVTPYVAGLYRINGRSCYVTAGIGTIALPVRLGAPPEITLLRLAMA
ncbi:MAG TPA: metallophosphoesterase [Bryobacteraceae bacterium]|jgi:hypothetical protein|nr:metallophosphoesterase [Bryobacteraceae bacterium]